MRPPTVEFGPERVGVPGPADVEGDLARAGLRYGEAQRRPGESQRWRPVGRGDGRRGVPRPGEAAELVAVHLLATGPMTKSSGG